MPLDSKRTVVYSRRPSSTACRGSVVTRPPRGAELAYNRTSLWRTPAAPSLGVCALDAPAGQADLVAELTTALHAAQQRPQEALTEILQSPVVATALQNSFAIDHCGLLLNCKDSRPLLVTLEQQGFHALQHFPSQILSSIISASLQKSVSIEIAKLARGGQKVELFLVQSGMTTDDIASECSSRSHIAVAPVTAERAAAFAFVDMMVRSGQRLVGSGINERELSHTAAGERVRGVTVLYFETKSAWNGTINKLELCVPGINHDLLQHASTNSSLAPSP